MKLSCLTFHDSMNYGSVLQSYALQTILENMGHEYEIIHYSTKEKRNHDSLLGRNKGLSFPMYLYKVSNYPQNLVKYLMFQNFRQKYLHLTPRFHTMEELARYADTRDGILVGSDQVWNSVIIRCDPAYFLKFVKPEKRMAYAASIGLSSIPPEELTFYQEMLQDFDRIGVREETAARLIGEVSGKSAQVVLDPTLLLTQQDWKKLCLPAPKKPYIFAYILEHNVPAQKLLHQLQKQTGLPVRYVTRGYVSALRDGATHLPSPQQWVTELMNAQYVVTSSFHGTAFCVNFNKTFFTCVKNTLTQSRQKDFLRMLGLESRFNPTWAEELSLDAPDFTHANAILQEKRIQARTFLETSLNEIEERNGK